MPAWESPPESQGSESALTSRPDHLVGAGHSGGGGNDTFYAPDGSTSTVTGGSESDRLQVSDQSVATPTNVTFTDYVEDQDTLNFTYVDGGFGYYSEKSEFMSFFDANKDNVISRLDGSSNYGGPSGESFAFSTSSTGQSVLTLEFGTSHVVLQGADYLI